MLSLVQYSDESDAEDVDDQDEEGTAAIIVQNGKPTNTQPSQINDEIEDDEYEAPPKPQTNFSKKLSLPAPKTVTSEGHEEINEQNHTNEEKEQRLGQGVSTPEGSDATPVTENLIHAKLPEPKKQIILDIVEEDDEFLRKKAIPTVKPPPLPTLKPKGPVKITIPSLKDFKDVDDDTFQASTSTSIKGKGCSLLSLLPKPRAEAMIDAKIAASKLKSAQSSTEPSTSKSQPPVRKVTSLVPDSVKRKAEEAAKAVRDRLLKSENVTGEQTKDDSDDSDTEPSDFFSFDQNDDKLPEISTDEITEMVAKRAAKIAETKLKVEQALAPQVVEEVEDSTKYDKVYPMQPPVDREDLHKLQGGNRAKRAKVEEIDFVEITDADLKPSRDEFLRTHLAQQTQFVPTGNLVGYDSTSKRKSQITYLAQKALANEQELQAMWSANRQKQRASSSKYGF